MMKKISLYTLFMATAVTTNLYAAEFAFDRPGTGMSTGIAPVGHLAWEQGLPNVSYRETNVDGSKEKVTTYNTDTLFRTGLTDNLEVQLGWEGPSWRTSKLDGETTNTHGLGNVSVGVKRSINLHDDRLSMALLAKATISTGNEGFAEQKDIYSLQSAVQYQYNENVTTSINMIYALKNSDWSITAIPTIGYKFVDKWSGYSELVYNKVEGEDYKASLGSGVIYALNQRTQLDANVGFDLNGIGKGYKAGLGFAYLF